MSAEGSELAKAYVTIAGDSTQLKKDLADTKAGVSTWMSTLAGGLQALIAFPPALLAVLGGGVFVAGAAALAGWTLKAIDAEEHAARLAGILDTVGRNSGQTMDSISQIAKAIELTSNFSSGDAKAAAAELLKFNEIKGDNFTFAMKAATDYATVLGTDLVSAANAVGMALQNPTAAIRSLRQVGLTVDQGKEIQSLVKNGQLNEARNLIMGFFDEMEGAAEKMTKTTQYSIDGLWRDIKRLGGGMGNAMLPVVKEFFDQMRNVVAAVKPGFDKMGEVMKGSMVGVKEVIASIGEGVTTVVQYAVTAVLNFGTSWEIVKTTVQLVFAKLMQYWENFKASFTTGKGAEAIESALVEMAFTVGKVFGTIMDTVKVGWQSMVTMILDSIDTVLTAASFMPNFGVVAKGRAAVAEARDKNNAPFERFDEAKLRAQLEADKRQIDPEARGADERQAWARKQEVDLLGQKLGMLVDQMVAEKGKLFPEGAKEAAIAAAKAALGVKGGFDPAEDRKKEKPVKFSFVGLADAWKKMQESLTGGTMIDLTRQGLAQGKDQLDELKGIRKAVEKGDNKFGDDDGIVEGD